MCKTVGGYKWQWSSVAVWVKLKTVLSSSSTFQDLIVQQIRWDTIVDRDIQLCVSILVLIMSWIWRPGQDRVFPAFSTDMAVEFLCIWRGKKVKKSDRQELPWETVWVVFSICGRLSAMLEDIVTLASMFKVAEWCIPGSNLSLYRTDIEMRTEY